MTENICSQGHVIDFGKDVCTRCNGRAIGQVDVAPVIVEPKKAKKKKVVKKEVKKVVKKVSKKKKK